MSRKVLPAILAVVLTLSASAGVLGADRDGDGLRDAFESHWGVTDPDMADTDGDGVVDSAEDNDRDRLSDLGEQRYGTDPGRRDSDGDGRSDSNEDADGNGIGNALEQDRRPLPESLKPTLSRAADDAPSDSDLCHTPPRSTEVLPCVFGDTGSRTNIAVFGDSHARQWIPALARAGSSVGWRIIQLTKSACPSISARVQVRYPKDRGLSCRVWRERAMAWLASHRPDVIIISNRSRSTMVGADGKPIPASRRQAAWRKAMAKTLAALPAGVAVVVVSDTPVMDGDPIRCLMGHRWNMSACATRRSEALASFARRAERDAAKAHGAKTLNLNDKICSYDPCPLVHGNILLWRDHAHLTATFNLRLWPTLRDRLHWAAGNVLGSGRRAAS